MARRRPSPKRQFNRTDRIGEQIREMVASELERLGDERLEMVTVTAVTVDGALETAKVFYSAMSAEDEGRDDEVAEALEEIRWRVQKLINREMTSRKTPQISFEPDTVLSSALRIEQILRDVGFDDEHTGGEHAGGEGTGSDENAADDAGVERTGGEVVDE